MSELSPPDTAAVSERTSKRGLAHNLEEMGGEHHQFVIGEYPLHLGDTAYGYERQRYTTFIPRFASLVNTHLGFFCSHARGYGESQTTEARPNHTSSEHPGHTDFDKGPHV